MPLSSSSRVAEQAYKRQKLPTPEGLTTPDKPADAVPSNDSTTPRTFLCPAPASHRFVNKYRPGEPMHSTTTRVLRGLCADEASPCKHSTPHRKCSICSDVGILRLDERRIRSILRHAEHIGKLAIDAVASTTGCQFEPDYPDPSGLSNETLLRQVAAAVLYIALKVLCLEDSVAPGYTLPLAAAFQIGFATPSELRAAGGAYILSNGRVQFGVAVRVRSVCVALQARFRRTERHILIALGGNLQLVHIAAKEDAVALEAALVIQRVVRLHRWLRPWVRCEFLVGPSSSSCAIHTA